MSSDMIGASIGTMKKALAFTAADLGSSKAPGSKENELFFVPGAGGASAQSTSARLKTAKAMDIKGDIVSTNIQTDLAINGQGLAVVRQGGVGGKGGAIGYTNNMSFRIIDNTISLTNALGGILQVWELDASGNLPTDHSSVEALKDASFKNITSKAEATDAVALGLNLSKEEENLFGPGRIIDFTKAGAASANVRTDIITPGEATGGAFNIGDKLALLPEGALANAAIVFEFGGISISRKITPQATLYNAISASGNFNVSARGGVAVDQNQLSFGQGIEIKVGAGQAYNFTATSASNQESSGQFNSLASFAKAVNDTAGGKLRATIGSDGRLTIAAEDANQSLSFSDISAPGGGIKGMVEMLGLDNVGVAANGINRYASLQELLKKVNDNNAKGISAKFIGNTLRFGAASAISSLGINNGASVGSERIRRFQRATSGYTPDTGVITDSILRRTVSIQSAAHGLKVGDYVKITGANAVAPGGNPLEDGRYRVDYVNDDSFAVAAKFALVDYGVGGSFAAVAPAVGTSLIAAPLAGAAPTATWQKVEGLFGTGTVVQLDGRPNDAANSVFAALAAAGGTYNVTITLAAANTSDALVRNDVVYISGSAALKPGYYTIQAGVGGPPFTGITVMATATDLTATKNAAISAAFAVALAGDIGHGGFNTAPVTVDPAGLLAATTAATNAIVAGTDIAAAVTAALTAMGVLYAGTAVAAGARAVFVANATVPAAVPDPVARITKVTAAPGTNIDTFPISFANATRDVSLAIPNNGHSYAIGDVIVFRGLAAGGVSLNNIWIKPDTPYVVKAKADNSITFEANVVDNAAGGVVGGGSTAAGYIGYRSTWTGVENAALVASAPGAALGSVTTLAATATSNPIVDYIGNMFKGMGIETNKELFTTPLDTTYDGGKVEKNFAAGTVIPSHTESMTIYDGYGAPHIVTIAFGKISNIRWTVEVFLPKNDQSIYDIDSSIAGQVASGFIEFDGNGQLSDVAGALKGAIDFKWKNGSVPTQVTIDWGAVNGYSVKDGKPAKPGVTQLSGPSIPRFIDANGCAPGSVVGYDYSRDGVISAIFSNGKSRAIYQIPVAMFANVNGLRDEGGFFLEVPSSSGNVLLQQAGQGGAGTWVSGAQEASTIDAGAQILTATQLATLEKLLLKAHSIEDRIQEFALQTL